MSSEHESTELDDEDLSCGLLLRDIEEIRKALYLHKGPQKPFNSSYDPHPDAAAKTGSSKPKSSVIIQDSLNTNKRSSLWNWKPLKALAHIRNHRFNCCFFLHIHAIEGLPPNFNDLNLCVTWKRKNEMLRSRPARACLGTAEFEETLMHRCTVYGSRTGPHGLAKYEPKIFLLHVSVVGPPELNIGDHWIDLSRLLPIKLEELEGDMGSSGKWTTSFKLTGEAKAAVLNVSFGFSILDGKSFEPGGLSHFADFDHLGNTLRLSTEGSYFHSQSTNVNLLEEIFPKQESELSHSVTLLYRKLDEKMMGNVMDFDRLPEPAGEENGTHEFSDTDFDVAEQGIEFSTNYQIKSEKCGSQRFDSTAIETIDVAEIFDGEETAFDEYVQANLKFTDSHKEHEYATNDNEHKDNSTCNVEPSFEEYGTAFYDMLTSKLAEDSLLDINNYYDQESYEKSRSTKSLSLDDVSESIQNDFLNMLSIDQSQDDDNDAIIDTDDCNLSFATQAVENSHNTAYQSLRSRRNAKALENLETKALMHEWGLTEKAFQYSPHANSGGFGSPVYIPADEPLTLPSIEECVGPIIRTKDGGVLRSMNPLLFTNANNGARLIVQVSGPVVLPPAMGFTVMEILQCLASGGVEKMCIQVNELMPLEDVTGKTMREVLSEAESESNAFDRGALQRESDVDVESFVSENVSCSNSEQMESDYVSLEDLVPMMITNIEGLLVQGLKIQSGMPDQEPPSSIRINAPELSCKFVPTDELLKYTLSLKEWTRLDSGEFCVQDETDDNTSKRFAAHCAEAIDTGTVEMPCTRNCGVFGKNLKMGLKVQLRDPLRNYEMVGSSMLALVQVDRIYSAQQEKNKIRGPLFKVSEVHLAGLNVTRGNKQHLWGTSRQQQSGSRWLLSSGMAKSNKNLTSNSNAVIKPSSGLMRKDDVLWSISLPNQGEGETWDDRAALNVHVRNPDITFP